MNTIGVSTSCRLLPFGEGHFDVVEMPACSVILVSSATDRSLLPLPQRAEQAHRAYLDLFERFNCAADA